MNYYIGQTLGVIVTIVAIIIQQLKSRKQILWTSVAVNILGALNVFFLDELQFSSGIMMNIVAVLQILVSLYHEKKGTEENKAERIIFLILYVGSGILTFHAVIDVFAIIAAVFYMIAMFQKKEQRIRLFLLANMTSWTIYHAYLRNAGIFAQIAGIISALIGLYRYRKK